MRKYLSQLPYQSDAHKKRFAFMASGVITLFIFSAWSLATFGVGGTLAINREPIERAHAEVGPIASLRLTLASSIESLKGNFINLKEGLDGFSELKSDYGEMRDNVLETYGQQ